METLLTDPLRALLLAATRRGLWGIVLVVACMAAAHAQPAPADATPAAPDAPAQDAAPQSLWERDTLTGDWGGWRSRLRNAGFTLDVNYIGEVLGNVTGGVRRGAIYEGQLDMAFTIDLSKFGWNGATFRASAYQIHGRGLSANFLGNNLFTASGIEALATTRLDDLYLQQDLFGGVLQLRAGQFAADEEFAISQSAANFDNSSFGWPAIFSVNLPSGGPAYPFATPGVRIQVVPRNSPITIRAAVFNGDPAGPGTGNPQLRNSNGTAFRVNDDPFAIAEIVYALNPGSDATGLPGTYKLGFWYHSGQFDDQRFDAAGLSLANPASTGVPASHRGNYAIYFVADQMLWRPDPSAREHGLSAFLRLAGSPSDRNLVDFYVDGGLTYRGLFPGRGDDILGLAAGYARISGDARGFDRDTNLFSGRAGPVRDYEALIELTYIAQMTPWLQLEPDLMVIFHPAANAAVASPSGGTVVPGNALVLGLRTAIKF